MQAVPFDTAKMVARYKAGGFTEQQAEVLTYTLLDVVVAMRSHVAVQLRQQVANQAWRSEVEALNRNTEAMERSNKLWMNGSLAVLLMLNIILWFW